MNRSQWVEMANRLARPVFRAAAEGRLHEALAVEHRNDARNGQLETVALEAMGRTLSGIAPWLDAPGLSGNEAFIRDELAGYVRTALARQSDPNDSAYLRFDAEDRHPIVDAAFLAQGLLRARRSIWDRLDERTQSRVHDGMYALRNRKPHFNNWLLFGAMTEAFLYATGGRPDLMRIDYAVRQHEQWYLGDGTYGDGPQLHWDYYNSYVIHPMLTDVLRATAGADPYWDEMLRDRQLPRLTRYAAVQERMIAPDGSYPVHGRSICYRAGAFQALAQAALLECLPPSLSPGQVRAALSAVLERTLGPEESWREDGFLRIGLSGAQAALGERYINTASLYLTTCALLPLGLAPQAPFWDGPEQPWTSLRVWDLGENTPADGAFSG